MISSRAHDADAIYATSTVESRDEHTTPRWLLFDFAMTLLRDATERDDRQMLPTGAVRDVQLEHGSGVALVQAIADGPARRSGFFAAAPTAPWLSGELAGQVAADEKERRSVIPSS